MPHLLIRGTCGGSGLWPNKETSATPGRFPTRGSCLVPCCWACKLVCTPFGGLLKLCLKKFPAPSREPRPWRLSDYAKPQADPAAVKDAYWSRLVLLDLEEDRPVLALEARVRKVAGCSGADDFFLGREYNHVARRSSALRLFRNRFLKTTWTTGSRCQDSKSGC